MSMNPDATNRIVSQQIKEWHVSREGDRNARLVEGESSPKAVLGHAFARIAATVGSATSALRRRLAQRLTA